MGRNVTRIFTTLIDFRLDDSIRHRGHIDERPYVDVTVARICGTSHTSEGVLHAVCTTPTYTPSGPSACEGFIFSAWN